MEQVNSSWQTPDTDLIRAAETNDSDIHSGDITDQEANTSDEDESSFFNDSFFDNEAVEEENPFQFFFKTLVETFGVTCSLTDYPCFQKGFLLFWLSNCRENQILK